MLTGGVRTGEHDRDCDVVVWSRGSTHEHVWIHDFLRLRCTSILTGVQDQGCRDNIIVDLRTVDAFGDGVGLEISQDERDAFAAILLAREPWRAYAYANSCWQRRLP